MLQLEQVLLDTGKDILDRHCGPGNVVACLNIFSISGRYLSELCQGSANVVKEAR